MIKQLKKVGNGQALFLDRALMDLVGLTDGAEVQVTVQGRTIIIAPIHPHYASNEEVAEALERVITERYAVLKRLAE